MQTMIHPGQQLTDYANYDITVQRIAEGGFGLVAMRPCQQHDNQWYALKTLKPPGLQDEEARKRFVRECLTWIALWPHPNIARAGSLIDISLADHGLVPFIALPYAEQGNLRYALGMQDPPLAVRVLWAQQIASGLAYLHTPDTATLRNQPLVHRDLKPENILITSAGGGRPSRTLASQKCCRVAQLFYLQGIRSLCLRGPMTKYQRILRETTSSVPRFPCSPRREVSG